MTNDTINRTKLLFAKQNGLKSRFISAITFSALVCLSLSCSRRLGHNIEDIEFVQGGQRDGFVVAIDGYDIYGAKFDNIVPNTTEMDFLFDLRNTDISWGPRGIAFIPDLDAFAFNNPRQIDRVFLTNHEGQSLGTIQLKFRDNLVPYHTEALSYLPKNAPKFGGHLLLGGIFVDDELRSRILVVAIDGPSEGEVVDEIVLEDPFNTQWLSAIEYIRAGEYSGHLAIAQGGDAIHVFNLEGKLVQSPESVAGVQIIEGLASTPNGNLAVADYFHGTMPILDPQLQLNEQVNLHYQVGEGVSFPLGVTYREDKDLFVITHVATDGFGFVSTSPDLGPTHPLFTIEADSTYISSLTWVPSQKLYGILRVGSDELWMVDEQGMQQEVLDLSAYSPLQAIDYVPSMDAFALTSRAPELATTITFISPNGANVGHLCLQHQDLSEILSLAVADGHGGPTFVVANNPEHSHTLLAFDRHGEAEWKRDYREDFGVVHPDGLTSFKVGPFYGFAATDSASSEIVLFHPDLDGH